MLLNVTVIVSNGPAFDSVDDYRSSASGTANNSSSTRPVCNCMSYWHFKHITALFM